MLIALTGLPGSGKSTIGRHVAKRLNVPLIDTDATIEARTGQTVRALFESWGEARFRELERQVLEELTEAPSGVLATGGGIVIDPANRATLRARCLVFYLCMSPDEIASRLRHDAKRPLLQGGDVRSKLRALHAQRDPLYRETAHHVIELRRPTIPGVSRLIVSQVELARLNKPEGGC